MVQVKYELRHFTVRKLLGVVYGALERHIFFHFFSRTRPNLVANAKNPSPSRSATFEISHRKQTETERQ